MLQEAGKKNKNHLFNLALITAIGLFIVNTTGFIDTMTNSVTGCGKYWPLCNGSFIPHTWNYHTWIEYGHRVIVLSAAILLVITAISTWRKYGSHRKIRITIGFAIVGVMIESFLGALSVFWVNPPALMATHMGVALISFGSMVVLTVLVHDLERPASVKKVGADRTLSRLIWFTFIYLFLAIYFGAYVSSTGAGGAFRGFPVPTESYTQAQHFLLIDIAHRTIGLGLLVLVIALVVLSRRTRQQRPELYIGSIWTVVLVCLQALSGALLIYTHLSLAAVMVHVSIVSLLFGLLCFLSISCVAHSSKRVSPNTTGARTKVNIPA
jgi:heme a synthase